MSVTEEIRANSRVCCANQTLQISFWVEERKLKWEYGIILVQNKSEVKSIYK